MPQTLRPEHQATCTASCQGTAHLDDPSDPEQVRAAVEKVLNEMNRSDGIYFEEKVNTDGDGRFFQLELEVDGDTVAHGGRFVWFNSRLQKVNAPAPFLCCVSHNMSSACTFCPSLGCTTPL